jgi:ATP/maltotriose-dependent transcriptional regulator MalT
VMMCGRAAFAQGETERAEKLLREAERSLKGLGDRGSLCEGQRALAMVLASRGRLDEAERYALQARETVGPDDRVSISTTTLGLGAVRAAQGRDAEAESLFLEAIEGFRAYDLRSLEHWALRLFSEFLRDRGRDDDAARYEERRDALGSSSTVPIV